MVARKGKQQNWLNKPPTESFYEPPRPLRRYLKLLVDPERFPNTPLTITPVKYPCDAGSPLHCHRRTTEVYFVLAGEPTAKVDGKGYQIKKGQLL